ncbi:E3 ubiquitin-protein ligase [Nematocida sp. AWRm80]|nr:E3 ubiquitin-protein ligase [Nematocida sp. AWRm80]
MQDNECIICYEEYDLGVITECNHRCCLKCGLRYKFISEKSGCPICLKEYPDKEMLFKIDKPEENTKFSQTPEDYLWGECIVCTEDQIEYIEDILCRKCKICTLEFYDSKSLMKHYSKEHNKSLCSLCVENRCEFPKEYVVYTDSELRKHCNGKGVVDGHPLCVFCRTRFYTQDILVKHCKKVHERCYLCERLGKKNEFYKSYTELEAHFNKAHYTCKERMCREVKCYAFIDKVELEVHIASLHPTRDQKPIRLNATAHTKHKSTPMPPKQSVPVITSAMPTYLDRTALLKARGHKDKYMDMLRKNYSHAENIITLVEEYEKSNLTLSQLVDGIREYHDNEKAFEIINRLTVYLPDDKRDDIKKNFNAIRNRIEFASLSTRAQFKKKPSSALPANTKDAQATKLDQPIAPVPTVPSLSSTVTKPDQSSTAIPPSIITKNIQSASGTKASQPSSRNPPKQSVQRWGNILGTNPWGLNSGNSLVSSSMHTIKLPSVKKEKPADPKDFLNKKPN